jgi:hypothetical protein
MMETLGRVAEAGRPPPPSARVLGPQRKGPGPSPPGSVPGWVE